MPARSFGTFTTENKKLVKEPIKKPKKKTVNTAKKMLLVPISTNAPEILPNEKTLSVEISANFNTEKSIYTPKTASMYIQLSNNGTVIKLLIQQLLRY